MNHLTLQELQDIEYKILCVVADFCEQNNIRYGIVGGTLLGAVRHGGFIPWDDDIDIEMPRPDYERFLSLGHKLPKPYVIDSPYENELCFRPYSKVLNRNTVLIEFPEGKRIEGSVYIDIFPIDGVPETPILQERHRKKCMRYMNLFAGFRISKYKLNESKGLMHTGWSILDIIQKHIIKDKILKRMDKLCKKYNFDNCDYCSEVIAGYGHKDTMPHIVYDFSGEVKFRDRYFKTFRFPEYYLINIYGKYWELPPEDNRIAHDIIAYYKQ